MSPTHPRAVAAVGYAVFAYAAFLVATAWAVTFLADLQLPRGIDHGARHPAGLAAVVDGGLLLLFAVQHTVMARAGFKRRLSRWLPPLAERSTYVLAASAVLLLLFWQWQPLARPIWDVHHVVAGAIWALFALGWLIAVSSTYMIDHLGFFGLRKAFRYARGEPDEEKPFREHLLYAWVRHPMMVGLAVAFWATPRMTSGHLLFAVAATTYIAIGVRFEERDLERELGEVYLDYADRVPAFIPMRPSTRSGPPEANLAPPDVLAAEEPA